MCLSLGCPYHAGPAADPRTDRHVAPRAAAEHPDPQRADSEDCQRGALIVLSDDALSRWSSTSKPRSVVIEQLCYF